MLLRISGCFLLLGWLLPSGEVFGQAVEHEDVEKIESRGRPIAPDRDVDLRQVVKEIVRKTNEFRREQERKPVTENGKLMETARYFADYMARTDTYGHTADGKRPAQRAKEHGYEYCIVLENIAYEYNSEGFTTDTLAKGFFEGWKHSPGHRRNMLDADVSETGVAVARSARTGYYYTVQMFGRPRSQAIEFQIANRSDVAVDYRIAGQSFSLPPGIIRTHQRCRSAEVTMRLPGGETRTVRPEGGDRFAVVKEGEGLKLRNE